MKAKTTLIIGAILGATLSAPTQSADLWRMYKCIGTNGEQVYSDRQVGTDCREIWLSPRGKSGWLVTDPAVKTAAQETDQ